MSAILKFDFQKREHLSKLHKKYHFLHVATTFPLKQGETSHGPIPHPLMLGTMLIPCGPPNYKLLICDPQPLLSISVFLKLRILKIKKV